MASRYFRNTGNTGFGVATNWSTTDGGAGDGAVPTSSDDVFFTANSGSCDLTANRNCNSLNCTGYTGALNLQTFSFTIWGSAGIILTPSMSFAATTGYFNLRTTCSILSNGKAIPNIQCQAGSMTITLLDNLVVTGSFTTLSTGTKTINGFSMTIGGSFSIGIVITGTTNFILNGTGVWSGTSAMSNNLTIQTGAAITISGLVSVNGNFTNQAGTTVITTGSEVSFGGTSTTIDPGNINWNNVGFTGTKTIVSPLVVNGTLSLYSGNIIFSGTAGFVTANLSCMASTAFATISLTPGIVYRVTASFIANQTDNTLNKMVNSTVPGTRATLTLDPGAVCTVGYFSFTDINAGGGRAINTYYGVVTNSINVFGYKDPIQTVYSSFAA